MAIQSTYNPYANAYSSPSPYQGAYSSVAPKPVAVSPVPTPIPPSGSVAGVSYTPQLGGGQMYSTPTPPSLDTYKNAYSPVQPSPTPTNGTMSSTSGFDMKYYPGWNETEARADWNATGGAKGRMSVPDSGNTDWINQTTTPPAPDKRISTTGDPRGQDVLSNPDANADFESSGMNMDEYLATIDQEAGAVNQLYDKEEARLRGEQPGVEKGITDQGTMLRDKALMRREDAQSSARRLYSELQQGYRQRFGGASSAGEAAQALTGNEQQRVMAQNNRTYQEGVAQIDLSESEAVRSAQSEFGSQIAEIGRNRTLTETQRLAARRDILQDLSNKVFQIKQQATAFKQNFQLMQEQARLQQEANIRGMSTNPTTNLTFGGNQTTASGNQGLTDVNNAIGQRTSTGLAKDDLWNRLGVGIPGMNY